MHYYPFNIGDYASHTRHLTLIEDLAYRRLLDEYYLHERPLNTCVTSVTRQINMRGYEAEVETILKEFFVLSEDGWINGRADRVIQHYHDKIEKASNAGKASAKRRLNGRSTDVQLNNNQEPITNNQKPVITPITNTSAIATVAKSKRNGSRLPNDWALPKDWGNWALERGLSRDAVLLEAETFRNYWVAKTGKDACKADWEATWRNWIIKASKDKPKTYYELTKEAKERDADKRLAGLASADMATLEALGLARDGRILGS